MANGEIPEKLKAALAERYRKKRARQSGIIARQMDATVDDLGLVVALYRNGGSTIKVARELGTSQQLISKRRAEIEHDLGVVLPRGRPETWRAQSHRTVLEVSAPDCTMLVGSDLHAWPDIYGTAMAAFIDFNLRIKPEFVILNGDGLDGAQISRHDRLGWDKRPSPAEEIEALGDYLEQIRKANPNAKYMRTRGNHDTRLETYLASKAPLAEGIKGTTLTDHIPGWEECIGIWVNGRECFIKHRGRHSGIHATFNEVRRLGTSFVHGHLHAQNLVQFRNAHGDQFGVDLGMMAPLSHPGFDYTEADITNWRSGFAVLHFRAGRLLPPQLATVIDEDRGELMFGGNVMRYEL